jgi:hypothetical protein
LISGCASPTSTVEPAPGVAQLAKVAPQRALKPLAPGIVQSASGYASAKTSVTATFNSAPSITDYVWFFVKSTTNSIISAPIGLTEENSSSAISHQSFFAFYGTGQTSVSYTFSGSASGNWSVTAVEVSGQIGIDTQVISAQAATSTPVAASINTTQAGDLVLAVLVGAGGTQTVSTTNSAYGNVVNLNHDGVNRIDYTMLASPGSTQDTWSASISERYYGYSLALESSSAASRYFYHGVQVFNGSAGTPDSIVNADISSALSDPDSSSVINGVASVIGSSFGASDTTSLSRINIDTGSDPLYTVQRVSGGHNPAVTTGGACTAVNQPCQWPYTTSYAIEGTVNNTGCNGSSFHSDCHYDTLDTSNDQYYEGWNVGWSGSALYAHAGNSLDLTQPSSTAKSYIDSNWGLAGLPQLGFADPGEDASLSVINYPLKNFIPAAAMYSACGANVNYAGTTGCGGSCASSSACLHIGDVLILAATDYSSYTGCTNPAAKKVLYQLEHFGSPLSDLAMEPGFYFAQDASGNDDWPSAVFTCLSNIPFNTTNWRLLSRTYF